MNCTEPQDILQRVLKQQFLPLYLCYKAEMIDQNQRQQWRELTTSSKMSETPNSCQSKHPHTNTTPYTCPYSHLCAGISIILCYSLTHSLRADPMAHQQLGQKPHQQSNPCYRWDDRRNLNLQSPYFHSTFSLSESFV